MKRAELISKIREVSISGKTYEEYVEAVADRLLAEVVFPERKYVYDGYVRYEAKAIPAALNVRYTDIERKYVYDEQR